MPKSGRIQRKNLNVSLPKPLLVRVRKAAAEEDKSVARFVTDLLEERVGKEPASDDAARKELLDFAKREAKKQKLPGKARNLTDDEIYGGDS